MPQDRFLGYEALGIAKLLSTRSLAVPFYQRAYSWNTVNSPQDRGDEKQQVSDFWSDLRASFDNKTSYFLGTAVVARDGENGRRLVIDGQQRLATTSILIAAIRDKFESAGASEFAASTQQEYLGKFNRRAGTDEPMFILGSDDRNFYDKRIVQRDLGAQPINGSQQRIADAYAYFTERVNEFASEAGANWRDRLNDLVLWLDEDVQVVAIDVATEADAFLIFETLNDRGADLTIADLLKNFLFSQAQTRLDEVRDGWVASLTNLGIDRVGNQRFTNFARHLLTSEYGPTRERDVFQRIKSVVKGPGEAVQFSDKLRHNSRLYFALLSSESDYWAEYSSSVTSAADVLITLNLEQHRPLALAALASFEKTEIERFMPSLVSWVIRGLTVGTLGAGTAEKAFSEAAREIRAGRVTTTEQILLKTRVGNLIPDDQTFADAFAIWRVVRGPLARYILRALELQELGQDEPELIVNDDHAQVNLEHILPKNATSTEWPNFTVEEQGQYVFRLGNQALLQRGPNGRIGNKGWSVKQPVLAASRLRLTSSTSQEATWSKSSIEQRQLALAELAVKAWPREPRP